MLKPLRLVAGEVSNGAEKAPITPLGGPCSTPLHTIDDLLFPINHGILYYPGYDVLPPFVTYSTDRYNEERFKAAAQDLRERMQTLETTVPIPYRRQNGGDYHVPTMELREGLETPGVSGFALHLRRAVD
jgi:NAD(P)H dehydrogenase (quinone)